MFLFPLGITNSYWNLNLYNKTKNYKKSQSYYNDGFQDGPITREVFRILIRSVADPYRKNADADSGKNLNADADSCPY
jgi:hypothetical protein